jgi:hypothetical protein
LALELVALALMHVALALQYLALLTTLLVNKLDEVLNLLGVQRQWKRSKHTMEKVLLVIMLTRC